MLMRPRAISKRPPRQPTAEAVASLLLSPSSLSATVGAGTQASTVTPLSAGGVALNGRTVSATSTNTGVATVSVTGYTVTVTPVAAGSCTINLDCEGTTDSIPVTVNAAPGYGYDPSAASMTNVVNRRWNTKASTNLDRGTGSFPDKTGGSEGWDGSEYNQTNLTVQANEFSTLFPGAGLRIRYPAGLGANTGPGVAQTLGFNTATHGSLSLTELYVRVPCKLGATYHVESASNKLFFHRSTENGGSNNRFEPFLCFFDTPEGGNTFMIAVNFQGTPDNNAGPNGGPYYSSLGTPGRTLAVDTEFLIETYLKRNSAYGVADGIFRLWIDGVLCIERLDVQYLDSATLQTWAAIHVSATYGGVTGGTNPTQMDVYLGKLHIWGK